MATAQQPTESNYSHFCYDWSSRCAQTHLIRSCLTSLGAVFSFFDEKDIPAKVTANYVTLPLVAAAALLHFPVAWLIQRLYRRTSFSEALDEYRKQIHCKPFTGPDATHPRNQGLQALTLRGLWKHFERFSPYSPAKVLLSCFVSEGVLVQTWLLAHIHLVQLFQTNAWMRIDRWELACWCFNKMLKSEIWCPNLCKSGFILERNMHFVVANIVTPLTQSKGVSFVTLWGGRRVDYFVSLDHCF